MVKVKLQKHVKHLHIFHDKTNKKEASKTNCSRLKQNKTSTIN